MSFWKKIFSNSTEMEDSQINKELAINDGQISENEKLEFDEKGWLTYSDGVKLKCNYNEKNVPIDLYNELGYEENELYTSWHNSEGKGIEDGVAVEDLTVTCYWELFTNKLICLTREDDYIMSRKMVDLCIKYHKKHIREAQDIPGMTCDAMLSLENGLEQNNIRQCFIERCFEKKSDNNKLTSNMFTFLFREKYLYKCFYDGYSFDTWNNVLIQTNLEDYYNTFKQLGYGWSNKRIKKLIDKQSEYCDRIDEDIRKSYLTMLKYSYDGGLLFNYIAIAAIYNQCDVSQDLFIESTFGNYIILSKEINNGITTTKIKAYNSTITFYNGHSLLEQSIDIEPEDSTEEIAQETETEGYIYVMINPSLEGMVKIGKTTRNPNDRVKELSSATGVPTPFILVFQKKFKNCHYTEKAIHKYLEEKGYRISENREFFKIAVTDAINVVQLFYDKENESQQMPNLENNYYKTNNCRSIKGNLGAGAAIAGAVLANKINEAHNNANCNHSEDNPNITNYGNDQGFDNLDMDIDRTSIEEEQAAYDDFVASLDMDN